METKYRKIVFTVYKENIIIDSITKIYQRTLISNLSMDNIENLLEFCDGYELSITFGDVLSFVDIYCINLNPEEAINRISRLETSENDLIIDIPEIVLLKHIKKSNTNTSINAKEIVLHKKTKFECGASGFGETIIYIASNHPVCFSIILSMVYDYLKNIIKMIFRKRHRNIEEKTIGILKMKRFYFNLGSITNTSYKNWQIISIGKITKNNIVHIKARNYNGDTYKVTCNFNMNIISMKLSSKTNS